MHSVKAVLNEEFELSLWYYSRKENAATMNTDPGQEGITHTHTHTFVFVLYLYNIMTPSVGAGMVEDLFCPVQTFKEMNSVLETTKVRVHLG